MAIVREPPICPKCGTSDNVSIAFGRPPEDTHWTDIWWCGPRRGCGRTIKEVEGVLR